MNHKRKRCRKQVRCTLCTPVRWLGNTKDRRPWRDVKQLADDGR